MPDIDTSALWAAEEAIIAAIAATAPFSTDGIRCELGYPDRREPEHVWLSDDVPDWQRAYADSAQSSVDEEFDVVVYLVTTRKGTFADVRDRLKVLAAAVETALRSEPVLAVLNGGFASIVSLRRLGARPGDGSRQLGLELTVRCTAYLDG